MPADPNRRVLYEVLIRYDLETGEIAGAHTQDVQFTDGVPTPLPAQPLPASGIAGVMDAAAAVALATTVEQASTITTLTENNGALVEAFAFQTAEVQRLSAMVPVDGS